METRSNHILVGSVVLALLFALGGFVIWLADRGSAGQREYDIFFSQSVSGLDKGAPLLFSGVPAGKVAEVALWPDDPQFVRVRVKIDENVPVLQGTTATLEGVGFTGISQISLDGAIKGAPEIADIGPAGRPVIPARIGNLGELLNTAPQLLQRLTTLSERLVELTNDKNQNNFANILENIEKITAIMARSGSQLEAIMTETRAAVQQAAAAAKRVEDLAQTTQGTMETGINPAVSALRKVLKTTDQSLESLKTAIDTAQPGLKTFSESTIPEANALIDNLNQASISLTRLTEKLDQEGIGAILQGDKLPDYVQEK